MCEITGGNKHTVRGRVELGYRDTTCRYYEKWNEGKEGFPRDQKRRYVCMG